MSIKHNCEWCHMTKHTFSPLALSRIKVAVDDPNLIQLHSLPSDCHRSCWGFFSPLDTSVWECSNILTFATASWRPLSTAAFLSNIAMIYKKKKSSKISSSSYMSCDYFCMSYDLQKYVFILQWCVSTGHIICSSSHNFSVDGNTPGKAGLAHPAKRWKMPDVCGLMPIWRRTHGDDGDLNCRLRASAPSEYVLCAPGRRKMFDTGHAEEKDSGALLWFNRPKRDGGRKRKKTASPLILIM